MTTPVPAETHAVFMRAALSEAEQAFAAGEVPVGAVVVQDGVIIGRAHNTRERDKDPLLHAEIRAMQQAAATKGDWRLNDCALYVTLEPCPMCLGALFQARIGRLFFGGFDEKRSLSRTSPESNAFPSLDDRLANTDAITLTSNNHSVLISGGLLRDEASRLLKDFFRQRRG